MRPRRLLVACGVVGLCYSFFASAQSKQEPSNARCDSLQNNRVLDERTSGNRKHLLAVDPDGRVLLLDISDSGHLIDSEPLGYQQVPPSDFPFASSLPRNQALLTLRRLSCGERNWKLWVAQTIGFMDAPNRRSPLVSNHLYVLRQCTAPEIGCAPSADTPALLSESFREINELIVDDINGDQQTEIAVLYADADARSWMKIWQVDDAGQLHAISLDDVMRDISADAATEIGLGDYRHGGEMLFTEQRMPSPKGWRVIRRYYDWDSDKHRYELAEIVQTDEITLK